MRLLLRSVQIIDPRSPYHLQKVSLLIENGIIQTITLEADTFEGNIDLIIENKKVSVGWCDLSALVPDPGFEYKETLQSAALAATAGGFTEVCLLPNTLPPLSSKDALSYITQNNRRQAVQFYPIASVTAKAQGEELAELIDLHQAGAIAFSDGIYPVQKESIIIRALQYIDPLNKILIQRPENKELNRYGQMHEGIEAVQLGMKGMPALAEEIMVQRDLQLLEYAGKGRLHFSAISCEKSVKLIGEAKRQGLPVSASVAAHQLAFTEADLHDFDTHFKVNPPFRTHQDIKALIEGLQDGTIDCLISDHQPQDIESKQLEFDLAAFGAIGLQTAFACALTYSYGQLSLEQIIDKLTWQPRNLLGLPQPTITVGALANLTIFDDLTSYTFDQKHVLSKSANSPFLGKKLSGRVEGVINNGHFTANPIQL